MVNYLAAMLVNMAAGLLLAAIFVVWGLGRPTTRHFAPALGMVGLVALALGLHMAVTWPLKGPATWANTAYGELSVLFGAVYLGGAWSLSVGRAIKWISLYAAFAGAASIAVGLRIWQRWRTLPPPVSTFGFVATGLGAILLAVAVFGQKIRALRFVAAVVLFAAAGLWTFTGMLAFMGHIERLAAAAG